MNRSSNRDRQVQHKYIVVPSVRDVYHDVYKKSHMTKANEDAQIGEEIN